MQNPTNLLGNGAIILADQMRVAVKGDGRAVLCPSRCCRTLMGAPNLGCTFGVLGSLAVSRIIRSLLFEVSATDPFIYLAAVLIMMATAILAAALAARRVACVDPIVSLRSI